MKTPSGETHLLEHIRIPNKLIHKFLNSNDRLINLRNEYSQLPNTNFKNHLIINDFMLMLKVSNELTIQFIIVTQVEHEAFVY
jgi:hypothetical protein